MPNLVGIGNSQVPTNAMLGGLAYQDSVGEIDLEKIKGKISGTARDIFVYDTRKDSDGGAWRHRTQSTSWYNEGASTDRGARKEFPTIAVIVGYDGGIAIYDGDDPNLSLWMRFRSIETSYAANYMIWGTYNVVMKNGWMYTGSPQGNGYENVITRVNFISEESGLIATQGLYYGAKCIADRNTANFPGHSNNTQDDTAIKLSTNDVQDLSIEVLSGAPIDVKTGLPTPTIAFTHNNGISVIRESGYIFDMIGTVNSGLYKSPTIAITKDEKLLYNMQNAGAGANNYSIVMVIPLYLFTRDISKGYEYQFPNEAYYAYNTAGASSLDISNSYASYFYDAVETQSGYFAMPTNFGLVNIQHVTQALSDGGRSSLGTGRFSGGMACEITKDYNTGWKVGDIRGVFLSDTDDTDLDGTEKITNPGPYSNATGWSVANAGFSVTASNSRLVINSGSNTSSYFGASQTLTLVSGKKYVLYVYIHSQTKTAVIRLTGDGNYFTTTGLGTGYHAFTFTANQATNSIFIGSDVGGNNRTQEVTSVSIREGDHDRSRSIEYQWRNYGLQTFGTVPKALVHHNGELVAYGPFTESNYLRQPYNSNLNFGSDAFSISVWLRPTANTPYMRILNRAQNVNDRRWELYTDNSVENLVFYTRDNAQYAYVNTDEHALPLNTWTHVFAVREQNGDMKIYINGREDAYERIGSSKNPAIRGLTSTTADLLVGNATDWDSNRPFNGQMALLRISATAPSTEQVKKIYVDEKKLFAENAKCTLYGTSDDVKTAAYDDTTDVTHVGTSSGRSDFNGLVRINNTTVGVTSAISASNGLIAEQ